MKSLTHVLAAAGWAATSIKVSVYSQGNQILCSQYMFKGGPTTHRKYFVRDRIPWKNAIGGKLFGDGFKGKELLYNVWKFYASVSQICCKEAGLC